MENIFSTIGNYFSNAFDSWDNYHKYGIIPNIWAGITGQKSAEMQTNANIAESQKQFDANLDFQSQKYQDELAFQREQYLGQMGLAYGNLALNKDVANRNLDLQQQAFDYQKQLNATQMEREDTAFQRQVADLQAAGMSPLAAIGGSGSGSTPLSSGSAPQMDISGINSAVGQYVDIARQYASLHAQATQNYMNGRNQAAIAHNSQILGARTALNQMKADMHFKGQNMATQYFNAAVNAKNSRLNREWIQEQIDSSKAERDWMSTHGYRNQSVENAIIALAEHFAEGAQNSNGFHFGESGRDAYNDTFSTFEKTFIENIEKNQNADITKMNEKQLSDIVKMINSLPKEEQKTYKNVKTAVQNEFYKRVNGFYR